MFSLITVDHLRAQIAIACFLLLIITAPPVLAQQPCAVSPASGAVTILPNVLVIFDNSGSMSYYADEDDYDTTTTPEVIYAGIFESDTSGQPSDKI